MNMSMLSNRSISPFISVVLVIATLLATVFVKMEIVREGYEILRIGQLRKAAIDQGRLMQAEYSRLLRPERLDSIGTQKLALARAKNSQVVLMAGPESGILK